MFISRDKREAVLTEDGELEVSALGDASVYKSGVYFQYKAQLYHVGLITSGGQDDAAVAVTDEWRLEEPVTDSSFEH